ncbi:MAG: AAA family ATPase [Anaerolineae bacterium]
MTIHISARLAWHDSGWNGCICRDPKANTYCVGPHSFPADTIVQDRRLEWEESLAGRPCAGLDGIPPCQYSVNAFGERPLQAHVDPPEWFGDGTRRLTFVMPPYSVATWPYEEMYRDEVINPPGQKPRYNADKRREFVNAYFDQIEPDRSLVVYYANYSNPFSEDEQNRYAAVGLSRIKQVGPELMWTGQSPERAKSYGPNAWFRVITSHYPDQGLHIPYDRYMDRPEVLERILLVPDNARLFKYATRAFSDDDALGLIERFREVVGRLQEVGDTSENWTARQAWLASLEAELWGGRGLYPGLARICDYLRFHEAIAFVRQQPQGSEGAAKEALFALMQGDRDQVPGLALTAARLQAIRDSWQHLEEPKQDMLRDVLPRFDLTKEQITAVLDKPASVSLKASYEEVWDNPYILSEQYLGKDADDTISFAKVDHGLFPSPELGPGYAYSVDNWRRLRALCVEQLRRANQHAFLPAEQVLEGLNHRLSFQPEWKRTQFTRRYLEVDQQALSSALQFRTYNDQLYLYLRPIFEDERQVESVLRQLAARSSIRLRFSVTEENWRTWLYAAASDLARDHPQPYDEAVTAQARVCQQIFLRPLSVLSGAAGTGKTTLVRAIIQAVERAHGGGTSVQLLAPTGKAADRLRELTQKPASTIHSFLAQHGWLNENMTFRDHGQKETGISTYILDESSMLDLPLLATFFRAVNWNAVQRLILVGDPNQLPPIGVGKVFSDLIGWLQLEQPESVALLQTNMRQLRARLTQQDSVILDLASLYIHQPLADTKDEADSAQTDELLWRLQQGGDVAGDLRVLYWESPEELESLLVETIVEDMERDSGQTYDSGRPDHLWDAAMAAGSPEGIGDPEILQVLSPYRGELYGVDHLNTLLQDHKNRWMLSNKGVLGGITYGDKVIQVRNRTKSDSLWAYDTVARKSQKVEVFNGEIGLAKVHGFDHKKWAWGGFRLERFQVVFSRKQQHWVGYESVGDVEGQLELAYAISVHKGQGSEFGRVYFVVPKAKRALMSRELFYTGLTRAQKHCTLLIQDDIAPLLSLRRRERAYLDQINSSVFRFQPASPEYRTMYSWYEEGKIHRTLTEQMVRSKSEVIIANILFAYDVPFQYEIPLHAPDGTFYLPDFTLSLQGETWYWEHLGMMADQKYRDHWQVKKEWYEKHGFADFLIVTEEREGFDSLAVERILSERWGLEPLPRDS